MARAGLDPELIKVGYVPGLSNLVRVPAEITSQTGDILTVMMPWGSLETIRVDDNVVVPSAATVKNGFRAEAWALFDRVNELFSYIDGK